MANYHEPADELSGGVRDASRALNSLKEEIEAVDWYNQRVDVTSDSELKSILAHNRDEEIEHACMALEWLRRNMPAWDENLREYLFSKGDITAVEAGAGEAGEEHGDSAESDLGIGSLA
ncbi:MAG: ferritin-like domain-containing protein [Verrucomicrobia bacterium]|nr:ferritin-like domain-containing protein [Verrucomicrobiota bacterium]MCF7709245.1 ferritin-like domain-containing protein [Verrucomicrobiota bacterium]